MTEMKNECKELRQVTGSRFWSSKSDTALCVIACMLLASMHGVILFELVVGWLAYSIYCFFMEQKFKQDERTAKRQADNDGRRDKALARIHPENT